MLRLQAAASSCTQTRHSTLARCCIIFTQHVVLRFWSQVLCYACTLPHHLARNTSCYACTLLHHLYATRRATLLLGGWGGLGGVGVGGVGWGGVITFLLLRSLGLFFVTDFYVTLAGCRIILHATRHSTLARCCIIFTQHVVLRFWSQVLCYACTLPHHLARNTSCYACTLLHHLYATRRATLLLGGVGGVGGGWGLGGWVGGASLRSVFCVR